MGPIHQGLYQARRAKMEKGVFKFIGFQSGQ